VIHSANGNHIPDRLEVSVKLCLLPAVALLILPASPTVAAAQAPHVPRVEIGGDGGMLVAIAEGAFLRPIVGPRLTFNISQRDAVELAADTLVPYEYGTYGFYFLQYKRTTRRTTRRQSDWTGLSPFFTVGTGGYYSYRKSPERRLPRDDGSVVVYPASSYGELSRLNIATVGGGFERGLSRHASFRFEGSGFLAMHDEGFLGFRILAGVSVPIGGYGASTIK
jgi:hypothetical protein